MKLNEFIKWVEEYPDQVVKDSGGTITKNEAGIMAYDALRRRGRLWGETERVAGSVCIPKHSEHAARFFDYDFFYDMYLIANVYKYADQNLSLFLKMAYEAQNTQLMALAFTEITPEKITELITKKNLSVDAFVAYFKYEKAFKMIEYIQGEGLPDTFGAIIQLMRHPELYSDCSFSSRWVHNACAEWSRDNRLSAESILFHVRPYIFTAAKRACFKNRALITAAKAMLYNLGIRYEPQFSV